MQCPKCGKVTYITKTINKKNKVFRNRKCKGCKYVFPTTEMKTDEWNYKTIVSEIKKIVNKTGA